MKSKIIWIFAGLGLIAAEASAQAVPEDSPAARVDIGYRRFSQFRPDPFRYTMMPHWGLVLNLGLTGDNTVYSVNDFRAVKTLASKTQLFYADMLDFVSRAPAGQDFRASAQVESGGYIGGPLGGGFALGASVQMRTYAMAQLSSDVLDILRRGNLDQQIYSIGDSRYTALSTVEVGGHALVRINPFEFEDGMLMAFGFGVRQVRPIFYSSLTPLTPGGGTVFVTPDSVGGDVALQFDRTVVSLAEVQARAGGSMPNSWLTDYIVRLEWPASGVALEGMWANVGTVTVSGVERSIASIQTVTADVIQFADTAKLSLTTDPRDTVDVTVPMPRIVRFTASAWANKILQIDMSGTLPVSGALETPLVVDIGTTWRFSSTFPLRVGMVLGGHQGIGYTAGFTTETRNSFLQVGAQTLGGFLGNGKGVGVRADLGFFF